MGSISSPGIGSGINVTQLVSQLVAAERAPEDRRIQRKDSEARADLAAFSTIRNALSSLRGATNTLNTAASAQPGRKTTVQEGAGFTASSDGTAALGRYNIEVVSTATAQKRQSAPVGAAVDLGTGTLSFTVDGETFNVAVAATNTITQLRDAINTATGGKGLSATVVTGDTGSVLVLNAAKAGAAGGITINATGTLSTFTSGIGITTPAANAEVNVNGVVRTSSSNRLTDLIGGVTLDLTKANPGTSYTLDIGTDNGNVRNALQAFIASYNSSVSALRTASNYNAETRQGGPLVGDAAVRGLTQQLRGAIGNAFDALSAIGIKGSKDGSLSLDAAKLDAALAADPSAVRKAFDQSKAGSLGNVLIARLDGAVAPSTGLLETRTKALNDRIKGLQSDSDRLNVRMSKIEENYRKQYTALDGLVSQLQTTSSFLSQQLSQISKI